ncbi:hypothetical protein TNCV_430321 [Trichonephila clavipes]|nr:hypothetical protein TNCV_430321 [Trichonephila clavipes]
MALFRNRYSLKDGDGTLFVPGKRSHKFPLEIKIERRSERNLLTVKIGSRAPPPSFSSLPSSTPGITTSGHLPSPHVSKSSISNDSITEPERNTCYPLQKLQNHLD